MKEFKTVNQIYFKSNNTTKQICNRYLYILITFFLYNIIYNLIISNNSYVLSYLKITAITLIISFILEYLLNLIFKNKEYNFYKHTLILNYFLVDKNIPIIILSILVSIIINKIFKKITISSSLFGIFLIYLSNIFTNIPTLTNLTLSNYIFGNPYISPLFMILAFIYLFSKKSIKYNLVITYNLTFFLLFLLAGIFAKADIWYGFKEIATGNILFFSIFFLSDYKNSPTISEGQILHGFLLGLLSIILKAYLSDIGLIISFIIGLFFVNIIDNLSIKLKYNKQFRKITIIICIFLIILTSLVFI